MVQKRILTALLIAAVLTAGAMGCSREKKPAQSETVVKIGIAGDDVKSYWDVAAKTLEKEGIHIELVVFNDYALPNRALSEGDIDLNSFQHNAFLQNEIKNHKYQITPIGNTVLTFLGVYSHKIKSLDELKDGDTIVIPNDATNGGRALKVLESAKVFALDPAKGNTPTIRDIISNPKNIKIVEVDASQTWRSLDDPAVTAAVVNGTFVHDAGANPTKEAIYIKPIDKTADKPYINVIAARTEDKDNPVYRKVVEAFQTPEVAKVILEEGSSVPAW